MYQLRRVSTNPNTVLKVLVDSQVTDDGGMAAGGSFFFSPAGQDGDRHQANGHAARVIMSDPGMAPHFECTPPIPGTQAAAAQAAPKPEAGQPAAAAQPTAGRKRAAKGQAGTK